MVEAGYKCSVPRCTATQLEIHHIDGDATNSTYDNLLVLCANHHAAATEGRIDEKACREIKALTRPLAITIPRWVTSIRSAIREELQIAKRSPRSRRSALIGLTDRKRLKRVLAVPGGNLRDMAWAAEILAERRTPGAFKLISDAYQRVRNSRTGARADRTLFEVSTVRAMGILNTKKSLTWLASQLLHGEVWASFLALLTLRSARNAEKYVGFKITSRDTIVETRGGHKRTVPVTRFRVRGENHAFKFYVDSPKSPRAHKRA